MPVCSTCKINKLDDEFSFRNKEKGLRSYKCKLCTRAYSLSHYNSNKQVYTDRALQHAPAVRARFKQFVESLRLECSQCGENHPAVLDFHHTDPSEKEANPSNIRNRQDFLAEIKKCVVLCSNCHRKLHWGERQPVGTNK